MNPEDEVRKIIKVVYNTNTAKPQIMEIKQPNIHYSPTPDDLERIHKAQEKRKRKLLAKQQQNHTNTK